VTQLQGEALPLGILVDRRWEEGNGHLGRQQERKWNLISLCFTESLNYRMLWVGRDI